MNEKYEFIPKFYEMNPETEDLLFDGSSLKEGMIVVIENPEFRADLGLIDESPHIMEKALRWNRWMLVTNLLLDEESDEVLFIGVYADITKKKIVTSADYGWYVKKTVSIPPTMVSIQSPTDNLSDEDGTPAWVKATEAAWTTSKGTSTQI